MKFAIYVRRKDFADFNGGDMVLKHIGCGLMELGHNVVYLNLSNPFPEDIDYVFFAGYWYASISDELKKSKAKSICHLEHFDADREKYHWAIDIKDIKADFFITAFHGECVDWASEYIKKDIIYFPFAGCKTCNSVGKKDNKFWHDSVYVGHRVPIKDFSWLEDAGVKIMGYPFDELNDLYINTKVVPYISSDFQRNIITDFFKKPGYGITERIFQVPLCGGFTVCDNDKNIRNFFNEDEMIVCETKDKFIEIIKYFVEHPDERNSYIEKARNKILNEHLYIHRLKDLFKKICV